MKQINFKTKLAGVSFANDDSTDRQEIIEDLEMQVDRGATVSLILRRESRNVHDPNAVAVLGPDRRQLGYLSRGVAETIGPAMDRGEAFSVEVLQITGDGLTQNYGVNIHIKSI